MAYLTNFNRKSIIFVIDYIYIYNNFHIYLYSKKKLCILFIRFKPFIIEVF